LRGLAAESPNDYFVRKPAPIEDILALIDKVIRTSTREDPEMPNGSVATTSALRTAPTVAPLQRGRPAAQAHREKLKKSLPFYLKTDN